MHDIIPQENIPQNGIFLQFSLQISSHCVLLLLAILLSCSMAIANNNHTWTESLSILLRNRRIAGSTKVWRNPSRFPKQLTHNIPNCQLHEYPVKQDIWYAEYKKEEKIIRCVQTPGKDRRKNYTIQPKFCKDRIPRWVPVKKCKDGYNPMNVEIDVIYEKSNNMLMAKKENVTYDCM